MSHLIAMLSEPRSGSSLIIQLLHCCPNVEVIDEPFHDQQVILENHMAPQVLAQMKKHFGESDFTSVELAQIAHSQTGLYLRALSESSNKEYLFFKVFRTHLCEPLLHDCILKNPDVSKLALRRNSLHAFISWRKAEAVSSWSHVDTTHVKVELDLEEFADFFATSTTWFAGIEQEMQQQNVRLPNLHYEDYALLPAWQQLRYVTGKLRTSGIEIQMPNPDQIAIGLTIQDRSQSLEQKISKPESLHRGLALRGLDHLLHEPPTRQKMQ